MVIDAFKARVVATPDRAVVTFVDDMGADAVAFSFGSLDRATDDQARHLTSGCGLSPGDRALLVYGPGPDMLLSFLGCLKAGIVPVPVAPPNPFNLLSDLGTLSAVAESSGALALLSHGMYAQERLLGAVSEFSAATGSALGAIPWHLTDQAPHDSTPFETVSRSEDEPAFLLCTSGSTSLPKGVTLTFANLRHQLDANRSDLAMGEDARFVSWLPHYHGFSLINGYLSVVTGNGSLWQLSPLGFVQRPAIWFDVMSRVRATHTAAPNFAYGLGLQATSAEERASWDLSSVGVMMSAAEPIHLPTMRAFLAAFDASKLDAAAFCPAYGLSEHTVGMTVNGKATVSADRDALEKEWRIVATHESPESVTLVGCGRPLRGVEIRIVQPETGVSLGEDEIGEVWAHSPSVAAGYWGWPDETEATFGGQLPGDDRRWLRTGDLGFLREGELFITGRLKDLIIVRGRNLYPADIEAAALSASPVLGPGNVVAFGVPDPDDGAGEQIGVIAEVDPENVGEVEAAAAVAAVRQRISQACHVPCGPVMLVRPGTILRTANAKIRRRPTRAALLQGALTEATWLAPQPEPTSPALEVDEPKRVCVVGGGISGVTAAYELSRLGHHVTLVEKEPIIGGKCESIEVDGQWFDLGGNTMSVRYVATKTLMQEMGMDFEPTTASSLYSMERRSPLQPDDSIYRREHFTRYHELRRTLFPEIMKPGFVHEGALLADPVSKWARRNRMEALARSFGTQYTAFGYGYLSDPDIPAMYFVKIAEIMGYLMLGNMVTSNVIGSTHAFLLRMAGRVAEVRTSADVRRVVRDDDGVSVELVTPDGEESLLFDEIVLALPLEQSLAFLDASPEEADLFGRIRYLDYYTVVATIRGLPRNALYFVQEHCADPLRIGHVLAFHHRYENSDVYGVWSYGNDRMGPDDIVQCMEEDVDRMGGVVEEIHTVRAWKYMPHVTPDDLDEEFFERFEALQGTNRTHYVGTLFNFELMEGATSYAWEVVRTHFRPASAGVEPRPPYEELLRRAGVEGLGAEPKGDADRTEGELIDWLRARVARELKLREDQVDVSKPLADYALDSLAATSILGDLAAWLGFQVSPSLFLEAPTIAEAAQHLVAGKDKHTGELTASELATQVVLDDAVRTDDLPVADYAAPRAVLLTGATGFLGAYLVRELMEQTDAEILCLVRAPDADAGMRRLQRNLEHFELWEPAMAERVRPVVGDLSAEQLGLSDATVADLSARVDAIYHNGATVNWVYSFGALEAANVRPLHTLLRIATTDRLKAIHFVSSFGVLFPPTPAEKRLLEENDDLDLYRGHLMGYVQTKWVCEKILALARERGVPVTVVRPPFIGGATDTGAYKTDNDIVAVLMKGCIQMGEGPDAWGETPLLPVDYVAEAIVALSRQEKAIGKSFNLVHVVPWVDAMTAMRDFGYPLETVPHDEWMARMSDVGPENILYSMKYLFTTTLWGTDKTFSDHYLPKAREQRVDDRNLRAVLGDDWPSRVPDAPTMLRAYLEYFVRSGFLEAPSDTRLLGGRVVAGP
jgi:thioester reductase-like protein